MYAPIFTANNCFLIYDTFTRPRKIVFYVKGYGIEIFDIQTAERD